MSLLGRVVIVLSMLYLVRTECPGVVSRIGWGALNPVHVRYLTHPVKIVIIQQTETAPCTTDDRCVNIMQNIQNYHMDERGFWDIASSFYVGGNAKIYEGNGWLRSGSHTLGYNDNSIGISFIGDYNKQVPARAQMDAVKDLIKCGVEQGYIAEDYYVVGHRQLAATDSPGRKLYNAIRSWPDWLEDVSCIKN